MQAWKLCLCGIKQHRSDPSWKWLRLDQGGQRREALSSEHWKIGRCAGFGFCPWRWRGRGRLGVWLALCSCHGGAVQCVRSLAVRALAVQPSLGRSPAWGEEEFSVISVHYVHVVM